MRLLNCALRSKVDTRKLRGACEDLEIQPYLVRAMCGAGKDEGKGH